MPNNITRCPKCNTSFRISDAHLNAAKGSVRCGSCLTIFRAKDHLITTSATTLATTPAKVAAIAPQKNSPATEKVEKVASTNSVKASIEAAAKTPASSQKVVAPDPFEDDFSEEFRDSTSRRSNTGEHDVSLFERDPFKNVDDDEEVVDQDDSWALDLLNNDDDETEAAAPTPEQKLTKEEKAITQEFETSYAKNAAKTPAHFAYQEEEFDNHYDDPFDDNSDRVNTGNFDIDELFNDNVEEHIEIQEPHPSILARKSSPKTHYLDAIEPEPVEFDWQRHTSFWQSKSLWTALSTVAAFAIVAQLAWMKFDTYSLIPPYRTYYAEACELLGCELPSAIDNSKIKTANLVIRTHPKFQNALIVDAVIQNTARFEQRFPTLELVFTDVQEKIVAARRLEPRDYLHGELAGRTTMPVAQPIHIAIEIEDPGKGATGYKMTIAN